MLGNVCVRGEHRHGSCSTSSCKPGSVDSTMIPDTSPFEVTKQDSMSLTRRWRALRRCRDPEGNGRGLLSVRGAGGRGGACEGEETARVGCRPRSGQRPDTGEPARSGNQLGCRVHIRKSLFWGGGVSSASRSSRCSLRGSLGRAQAQC